MNLRGIPECGVLYLATDVTANDDGSMNIDDATLTAVRAGEAIDVADENSALTFVETDGEACT